MEWLVEDPYEVRFSCAGRLLSRWRALDARRNRSDADMHIDLVFEETTERVFGDGWPKLTYDVNLDSARTSHPEVFPRSKTIGRARTERGVTARLTAEDLMLYRCRLRGRSAGYGVIADAAVASGCSSFGAGSIREVMACRCDSWFLCRLVS